MDQDLGVAARELAEQVVAVDVGSASFQWLPHGMGKRSIRWSHSEQALVLQVRAPHPQYEPVAEACAAWSQSGCDTLPLLKAGTLRGGERFYVFPFVPWLTAAEWMVGASRVEHISLATRVGEAFARLNSVRTERYGEFSLALKGTHETWEGFLRTRFLTALESLTDSGQLDRLTFQRVADEVNTLPGTHVEEHLVYVDVKLDNVLISPDGHEIRIVDYDYLLTGDSLWSAGRVRPLYGPTDVAEAVLAGFRAVLGDCWCEQTLRRYEVLHSIELLSTPAVNEGLRARRGRLLHCLRQIPEWSHR